MKADKIKLYTAIRDYGQMINKITFQMDPVVPGLTPDDLDVYKRQGAFFTTIFRLAWI